MYFNPCVVRRAIERPKRPSGLLAITSLFRQQKKPAPIRDKIKNRTALTKQMKKYPLINRANTRPALITAAAPVGTYSPEGFRPPS
jgi:hypothetical protein